MNNFYTATQLGEWLEEWALGEAGGCPFRAESILEERGALDLIEEGWAPLIERTTSIETIDAGLARAKASLEERADCEAFEACYDAGLLLPPWRNAPGAAGVAF